MPGPGSIAFTGFNADGNDNLSFVALEAISSGTVIRFTENEWNGSAFADQNEANYTWTATSNIAAGTIVRLDSLGSGTATSNLGSVVVAGNRGLNASGDQVYAYTGTSATSVTEFLAAVSTQAFDGSGTGSTYQGVLTGTGLAVGTSAVTLATGSDIGGYTGARDNQTSYASYAAQVNNVANWATQDGSGDQSADGTAPDAPFPITAFTLAAPTPGAFSISDASISEGDAGTQLLTFTVTRTNANGDVTVGYATSNGSATAGSDYAATSGTLSFTNGGALSQTVSITINGDSLIEADETFAITLANATGGATIADADGTGTILNDDPAATPITILDEASSLAGSAATPVGTDSIDLQRIGSIASSNGAVAGGAESVAYDATTGRAYVTNAAGDKIDIVQIGADGSLTNVGSIALGARPGYGEINSVAVKNGVVAVAIQNSNGLTAGEVVLFDGAGTELKALTVGVLPDMLTFTPDGSRILVANEAEAQSASSNPVGSISIIDLSGGAASAVVVQNIGFDALNGTEQALRDGGVYIFNGQSAAADIEPEYISVSPDGTRAYVTLQEVNAVAVIDLTDPLATQPLAILPLGGIDRSLAGNAFDPVDTDGIDIGNFDVKSLLQPDAIASFEVGGTTYFVTANEGDARVGITDEVRLSNASYVLDPTAYPDAATLKGNSVLGRLNVIVGAGDTDLDGDIDQITTYGGRSISIFRQEADGTITKVRETGGEFEGIFARDFPAYFNTENGATVDTRSDNKGPEPEGVTIGVVIGRTYAFVTLERVGGVMIYDVTDPANAQYVGYKVVNANDYAPETLTFIGAADNPTGQAIVLTANEVSGTLTLFSVRQNFNGTGGVDTLVGSAADDVLEGLESNDLLRGLGGDDRLLGGDDNDTLEGGEGADDILGEAGVDTISFINASAGVTANLQTGIGTAGEATGDRYRQIENIEGSDFADQLTGDTDANTIHGRDGDDVITGFGGADSLFGEDGNDQFLIVGGPIELIIDGGRDIDTVLAGRTNAIINYNALTNIEAIDADGFANVRIFGTGTVDLSGFTLTDIAAIQSFGGDDVVTGTSGSDVILSGGGKDQVNGGLGDDTLFGGDKTDVLTGGDGADSFALASAGESIASIRKADTVTDFDAAEGDTLDFSAIDAIAGGGDDVFTWVGFNALTGVEGQVGYYVKGGAVFVGGDIDGDASYDFLVKLDGVTSIDAASVIL